ncbi:MAG: hypothetical protein CR975_01260 [Gammaproteobacteria bacterium]|nr:MAG: hypothetical protein CR975_01260 [Gammaproteobacteria bacterium]
MKYFLPTLLLIFSTANAQTYYQAKSDIAMGASIQQYSGLRKHPLYPYLAADYYRQHLDLDSELVPLFQRFYSAPPIKALHNRWIKNHFNQGNFQQIVRHYYDTGDQTTACMYRQSQLLLGNSKAALQGIEQVWLSPRSVSDYCTPVFAIWPGKNEPKNLLKRAKLAYFAGNGYLAASMANQLMGSEGAVISQFAHALSRPTSLLNYTSAELTGTPLQRELLPLALEKLIRKDSSAYAGFAMQFAAQLRDNQAYQRMLTKLVGYLSNRQDPQAKLAYALLSHPDKDANEALLRFLAGSRDWQAIKKLVSPNDKNAMALYWLGRATEALGNDAKGIYQKAAQNRSYYGFLAADKIGKAYVFNAQPIIPNQRTQQHFNQNIGLIRGKLLHQMGDGKAARKEILPLAKRMSQPTQRQLAYWLNQQGLHYDAIYILGQLRDWNDIRIRFPTPFNSQVETANRLTQVDPTWIYAIIRQESSMNPRAVSRSKAKGLMQLIPGTARMMARDTGIILSGEAIFNPDINTKLGAEYLNQMYQRFGNIALASAAYNAGPNRVDQWINQDINDMPIWVEKIPFNETRKYVKHIVEYQQVYAKHLGKKIPTLTEIISHKPAAVAVPLMENDNQLMQITAESY